VVGQIGRYKNTIDEGEQSAVNLLTAPKILGACGALSPYTDQIFCIARLDDLESEFDILNDGPHYARVVE
jgi:hypothetical protein